MPHSEIPLPPAFSEEDFDALLLEAAGLPAGLPMGRAAPGMPPIELAAMRDRFSRGLHAVRACTSRGEYVAVWLEAWVEEEVDAVFAASPERGFWLHALALALCLAATRGAAPEAAACGCASVPVPDAELAAALNLAGLACADANGQAARLHRRYAVLTHAGACGCGVCALAEGCPRLRSVSV